MEALKTNELKKILKSCNMLTAGTKGDMGEAPVGRSGHNGRVDVGNDGING